MRDLDLLFKEKREEPTTVSIELVQSWINGGALLAGLLATLKKLLTKKSWLMYTSISSIAIVTLLTIFQLSAPKSEALSINKQTKIPVNTSAKTLTNQHVQPTILDLKNREEPINGQVELLAKMTQAVPNLTAPSADLKLIESKPNAAPQTLANNDTTKYFDRIDVNGSINFTLVNGNSCSVSNLLREGMEAESFQYKIKNGTLFLDGVPENEATLLVITVPDLHKIKINGFCQIVTPKTFTSSNLEVEVNGFVKLDLDLSVQELELDLNGENTGEIRVKSENFDFEINGMNDIKLQCEVKNSWIEINGITKLEMSGTSVSTMMHFNGESSKLAGEAFISQDLMLQVTGINQKIETTVLTKLDIEISGSSTVTIQGTPEITHQEIGKDAKLKMK
jgi:hypothetical protein